MNVNIELPIYHNTDETLKLKEMNIDYDLSDCIVKYITFYNIDAISPLVEDDEESSSIWAAGTEFTCPIPYEKLQKILSYFNGKELVNIKYNENQS